MSALLDVLSGVCLLSGAFFCIVGTIVFVAPSQDHSKPVQARPRRENIGRICSRCSGSFTYADGMKLEMI